MQKTGFTLIELLVTVAIVAILGAVAYPSYLNYTQQARRSEAQAKLLDIANRQELYYLDHHTYAADLDADLNLGADPFITENGYYSIASSSVNSAADFTLTATAIAAQAADSDCATLSITESLNKTATNANGADCWR